MLFRKNIEPSCSYCRNGIKIGFDEVMCRRHGIVTESSKCSYFRYEPTKREPEFARNIKAPDLSGLESIADI